MKIRFFKSAISSSSLTKIGVQKEKALQQKFGSTFAASISKSKYFQNSQESERWHRHINRKGRFRILLRLLPYSSGYPMERLERVLYWIIPVAVIARVICLCI